MRNRVEKKERKIASKTINTRNNIYYNFIIL